MNNENDWWEVQTSLVFGPHHRHMTNIRGRNPQHFAQNANAVEQIVESIKGLGRLFDGLTEEESVKAEQMLSEELGGNVIARVCPHGTMTLKSGATWEAWMCPARKDDPTKCQPIDAKTGKAWPKR